VPYFRLFNPLSQSAKFDPDGRFLRRWLPEMAELDKRGIHNPAKLNGLFAGVEYPSPIIDLPKSRERALSAFRQLGEAL
jgi:deoxyribodipyrimidine photo-lyase